MAPKQSLEDRRDAILEAAIGVFAQTGKFHHGTAEQTSGFLIAQLEGLALMWAIAPQFVAPREQWQWRSTWHCTA